MPRSRLSSTQVAILRALAGFEPRWTLTGGAALAGFHLGHRTTRDLDLFWQGHDTLGDLAAEVSGALGATGFTVRGLRRTPAFARLHVESADGAVEVDLVADPVARVEAPERVTVEGTEIEIVSDSTNAAQPHPTGVSRYSPREGVGRSAPPPARPGAWSRLRDRRRS